MDTLFIKHLLIHSIISIPAGICGCLLGIVLGNLFFKNTKRNKKNNNTLIRYQHLIPWYGIGITGLVFLLNNSLLLSWFGLGNLSAIISIFFASTILALLIKTLSFELSKDMTLTDRYFLTFRIVIPSAIGFAVTAAQYGVGGAGPLIQEGINRFVKRIAIKGYAIVGILASFVDLLILIIWQRFLMTRDG